MTKTFTLFILLFSVSSLYSQKCKVEDKYGEVKDLYDEKGNIVPGYYIVYPTTGGHGVSDENGNEIVPWDYDDMAFTFCNGKIIAKRRDKKLVHLWDIKTKTKIKLPAVNAGETIGDNGLIAIQAANKKWGYCDSKGKLIIPAKFDYAEEFVQNKAVAQAGDNYGIINEKGTWVVPPKKGVYYHWITSSLLALQLEDKNENIFYGLMDNNGKTILAPTLYTNFEKRNGFIEFKIDKTKGALFNYAGKKLTDDNCYVKDWNFKTKAVNGFIEAIDSKGFFFVIDTTGKRYLENKYGYIYRNVHYTTKKPSGLYTVETKPTGNSKSETYAVVKLDGTVVLDGQIDDIVIYDDNVYFTGVEKNKEMLFTMQKADGTILAKDICNAVVEIHRHFAFVKKNGFYGAINMQTTEWAIPIEYKGISSISECSITLKNKNDEYIKFDQNLKQIR